MTKLKRKVNVAMVKIKTATAITENCSWRLISYTYIYIYSNFPLIEFIFKLIIILVNKDLLYIYR